jgi:hypothetical protein
MNTSPDGYLTSARVLEVYQQCWRPEGSAPAHNVEVEGWLVRHTFSIMRLQRSRETIIRMLLSLHPGFRSDEGQGGSVGAMVTRGDGNVWSTDLTDIEKLVALGLASGLVTFCAPRDKWASLPGGLPYVRVEITMFGVSVN